MADQILLKHELTSLGHQAIALRPNASKLYKLLVKNDLISFMKRSDHLGVISSSHPSNNHKRWDYVVLQLKLLQALKNSPINSGLSSAGIKELPGVTGEDFLQCCILLSNIGHLPGTISSERSLLKFLEENQTFKTTFLSNINSTQFAAIINDVFDQKDYYKLKYLIALNFLTNEASSSDFVSMLRVFLENPIEKDSVKIGKLKMLFFKLRRIAFVYLDGYNSDFPLHISITKIMLDINNYEHLFNPNSTDFEQFFKHSEETLTKKLYINLESSFLHHKNHLQFNEYLWNRRTRLDFKNILVSIIRQKNTYTFNNNEGNRFKFQAYFSNSDINDFSNIVSLDFKKACKEIYTIEGELNNEINKALKNKSNSICVLNDNRKDLVFVNMFFDKFKQSKDDTRSSLKNMNIVCERIFNQFVFTGNKDLKEVFEPFLQSKNRKAFVRKYLHFIIKYLIAKKHYSNNGDFNVFIKFDYLRSAIKNNFSFNETVYYKNKKDFLTSIDTILTSQALANDLLNNVGLIKHIITKETKLSKNLRFFCSYFPYEVEQVSYKPELLEKSTSAHSRKVLTDIDSILIIFNDTYFELYIIEGKDVRRGIETIVSRELNLIRDLFEFTSLFSQPKVIRENGAKGGYICCTNK